MFQKISFIRIAFALLLSGIYSISFSQTIPVIGLKQAIDSVGKNYPGLKAKLMQVKSADFAITDAKHQALPSLNLSDQMDMGTANSLDGSYFPMGMIPSTSGSIRSANNSSVFSGNVVDGSVKYELENFGLNRARVQAAKAFSKVANADYGNTKYWLQYRVTQLYFELLKYNLLSKLQERNIDRYVVLYNYIKAYTNTGLKAGVDSSVANAQVSKAKILYIKTQEVLRQTKAEFAFYTGIKSLYFEVDTNFYHLHSAVLNHLQAIVSGDTMIFSNPLINYYQSRWDYSLSQEKLIKKSFLPKIYFLGSAWARGSSIGSNDSYGSLSSGWDLSRNNYMLGLAFTYNIVDILHRKDQTHVQYFQTETRREELAEQKSLLSAQLNQSDIAIQSSLSKIREIPVLLKASRDAYSQKLAQYSSGLVDIVALTDVAYLLFGAETSEIEARAELLDTLLQKAVTNNTLNAFISNF